MISPINSFFETGTLCQQVKNCTNRALECGALHSISTESEVVEEAGIKFIVRVAVNLQRKERAKKEEKGGKDFNPFLPYEEDLFVSGLTESHLCLLNKFNVVDNHLLIVTREFQEQENWLNEADFAALDVVLQEVDGLGFYNCGKLAGASQRHKHLQVVPAREIPIAGVLDEVICDQTGIGKIPVFDFVHSFAWLEKDSRNYLQIYHQLLQAVGFEGEFMGAVTGAYNLLVTTDWMLIVRRSSEDFEGISINSLGFAGSFFVPNQELLARLKKVGCLQVLKSVSLN